MIAGRNIHHNPERIQQRFWSRIAVTQDTNRCWLWTRGCFKTGYGEFSYKSKPSYAHRLAYVFFHSISIEDIAGWEILHNCDNPPCCNPHHLKQGTHKENMDDIILRGHPKYQKIPDAQIRYIREQGQFRTQTSIAKELHISQTHVSLIVNYKTRRYLRDE